MVTIFFFILFLYDPNGVHSGDSSHFTNFALLLGANMESCAGNDTNNIVLWLSMASLIVALVIVSISVVIIEVRKRFSVYRDNKELTSIVVETYTYE